jgi:hypothetical protein
MIGASARYVATTTFAWWYLDGKTNRTHGGLTLAYQRNLQQTTINEDNFDTARNSSST